MEEYLLSTVYSSMDRRNWTYRLLSISSMAGKKKITKALYALGTSTCVLLHILLKFKV